MSKVKIINNIVRWGKNVESASDLVLSAMATDILRLSKQQVPLDHGQLQSSGLLSKKEHLKYRLSYNKKYATYQHRGSRKDGSYRVRSYTYPGKKSKYLLDPARIILEKQTTYLTRYLSGVKA